jgi:hypothetical protein
MRGGRLIRSTLPWDTSRIEYERLVKVTHRVNKAGLFFFVRRIVMKNAAHGIVAMFVVLTLVGGYFTVKSAVASVENGKAAQAAAISQQVGE